MPTALLVALARESATPAFLTSAEIRQAERERKLLEEAGNSSVWLCRETLAWVKAKPGEFPIPEALHLAGRSR